jgi:hypothetical protein
MNIIVCTHYHLIDSGLYTGLAGGAPWTDVETYENWLNLTDGAHICLWLSGHVHKYDDIFIDGGMLSI